MAINFPNDPATSPGDGGQWTDPDGNTWQVEIIGGEAVWTMIQAASVIDDPVLSVNTQTGAVSLGIQDMNDYAAPTGVVDGDVLTWNAAASQFQPVDPEPPGSPLDALVSVDGDAAKYGTAPTLGTDTTDVVIPTMGQVRAEIASNEGPIATYVVGNESTTSYKFTGPGLDGTELNPTLYLIRGEKYIFSNTLGAHPFQLQTVAGTGQSPYTDGVTGSQPIDATSFEWEVQMDAPSTIYYQCTAHASMTGTIQVLDSSGGGGGGAVDSVNTQTGVVSLGIQDMNDYETSVQLAAGDVLQWSATDSKFKNSQLPASIDKIQDATDLELNLSPMGQGGVRTEIGGGYMGITIGGFRQSSGGNLIIDHVNASGVNEYENGGWISLITSSNILYAQDAAGNIYTSSIGTVTVDLDPQYGPRTYFDVENALRDVLLAVPEGDVWTFSLDGTIGQHTLPLAEGDHLEWNASESAFKPVQLVPVAKSGDYNDLTNTPDLSLKADLVNGQVQADQLPPAAARKTVDITATLDAGATTTGEVTGTGATGFLLSCQTNVACWIRLYTDSALMTADAGRVQADDPAAGSGVLFEALYTTISEKAITPGTTYFNLAGDDKLYYRLTNESVVNGASMTVTLKLLPME